MWGYRVRVAGIVMLAELRDEIVNRLAPLPDVELLVNRRKFRWAKDSTV